MNKMVESRIIPESSRKKVVPIVGGTLQFFYPDGNFNGNRFNVFQIYNDGISPLYVGMDSNLGTSGENGIGVVVAGGTGVFALIGGIDTLFFRSAGNGSVRVYYFYQENLTSDSLYQNLATVIINSTTTSTVTLGAPIPAGDNNIGNVDIVTMPAITGTVGIGSALPAGANNIGDVDVLSLPAIPAGSNLIGAIKITDAGGTNQLDVLPDNTNYTPASDMGLLQMVASDEATRKWRAMRGEADGRVQVAVASGKGAGTIAVTTITTADTEYSYSIPAGTHKVEMTLRRTTKVPANSGDIVRIAWATGQVGAGTGNCKTFTGDKEYSIIDHKFESATTIYFTSSVSGSVMEIVTYA